MSKGRAQIQRLTLEHRDALSQIPLYSKSSFEFLDGWFYLIYDLGQKINSYCLENNIQLPKIQQIKEKFGTLRFYYSWQVELSDTHKDVVRAWVRSAEDSSETICEHCGESGQTMVDGGVFKTVCKVHTPDNEDVYTVEEFAAIRNEQARKMRKCDICDEGYSEGYFDGEKFTNRCENHKETLITTDEYLSQKNEN